MNIVYNVCDSASVGVSRKTGRIFLLHTNGDLVVYDIRTGRCEFFVSKSNVSRVKITRNGTRLKSGRNFFTPAVPRSYIKNSVRSTPGEDDELSVAEFMKENRLFKV